MTLMHLITEAVAIVGARPPKVTVYANCVSVSFRNGEGQKVLVTFDHKAPADAIKHKIATAYKIKAENIASDDKVNAILGDVKPRAEIQKYQEAKKA